MLLKGRGDKEGSDVVDRWCPINFVLLLMDFPGLGLFEISGAKKTKLLNIFEETRYLAIVNSRNLAACKLS